MVVFRPLITALTELAGVFVGVFVVALPLTCLIKWTLLEVLPWSFCPFIALLSAVVFSLTWLTSRLGDWFLYA
ncbi:MAG: hypothetical protein AAFX76_13125 [Planctomycetota bacterium]